MRSAILLASLLATLPSALALSGHHGDKPVRHGRHAARAQARIARELAVDTVTNSTEDANGDLHKRAQFNGVAMTNFDAGVGNCGSLFTDNDFVVALSTHQWDGGSHCFKPLTIEFEGRKIQATVADQCMGCPDGAIDLTKGLFKTVAPNGDGKFFASWSFGSGGDDKPDPPPKPSTTTTKEKPTPTPTPTPTPPPPPPPPSTTSTKEKPTTSSTSTSTLPPPPTSTSEKKPDPTTTSSTSSAEKKPDPTSTSASASASAKVSTTETAASLVGAASPIASAASGLELLNEAYLGIAGLVAAKTIKQ